MSAVVEHEDIRKERLYIEAKRRLKNNAVQATQYVALGNVMKKELAEKFELPEADAECVLGRLSQELTEKIMEL